MEQIHVMFRRLPPSAVWQIPNNNDTRTKP